MHLPQKPLARSRYMLQKILTFQNTIFLDIASGCSPVPMNWKGFGWQCSRKNEREDIQESAIEKTYGKR